MGEGTPNDQSPRHAIRRSPVLRAATWSVYLNLAGKTQSLAILVVGALSAGFSGIGHTLTVVGAALLASSLADFGFSSEAGRSVASHPEQHFITYVSRRIARRSVWGAVLGPSVLGITAIHTHIPSISEIVGVALYSCALVGTLSLGAVLFGLLQFAFTCILLGTARLLAGVASVAVVLFGANQSALIWIFGVTEFLCALVMIFRTSAIARRLRYQADSTKTTASIKRAFGWLGLAAALNVVTNQSDVLIVNTVLSSSAVGVFGVASQIQNAGATLAVAVANPTVALVARSAGDAAAVRRVYENTCKIVLKFSLIIVGFLAVGSLVASNIGPLADRFTAHLLMPVVLIALLSIIPSALAFVEISMAIGLAEHKRIGLARCCAGFIAIAAIYVLARLGGVIGASLGMVIRDTILWAAAKQVSRRIQVT